MQLFTGTRDSDEFNPLSSYNYEDVEDEHNNINQNDDAVEEEDRIGELCDAFAQILGTLRPAVGNVDEPEEEEDVHATFHKIRSTFDKIELERKLEEKPEMKVFMDLLSAVTKMGVTEEHYKDLLMNLPMFKDYHVNNVKVPCTLRKLQNDVLKFVGNWLPILALPPSFVKPKKDPSDSQEKAQFWKGSYISFTR